MVTVADASLLMQAASGAQANRDVEIGYDRRSDTLMIHFYGRGVPAVSVPVGDDERDLFYVRVEPATNRPVGVQIEGFLASFLASHPDLAMLLDVAELRGITREEVLAIRASLARDSADTVIARFLAGAATE